MVNQTLAFEALIDWNFWGSFKEELKQREAAPKLSQKNVLVIKGVRRSGKSRLSYILANTFPITSSLLINFEDPRLKDIEAKDIIKLVEIYQRKVNENLPELLILDEVQNVNAWEKVARLYSEAKNVKVVVTGSSSKLMSEEYATVLTGRHVDFELFPLSFREFLIWSNIKFRTELDALKNKVKILKALNSFIETGGFPAVFLIKDKREKTELLRNYFNDILMKDIVKRYSVREIEKTEKLANVYISSMATLQSFNKLKNIVGLSLDSVERFSRYFEISRLLFFIPKFSFSFTQQMLNVKKVYCIDQGFFTALGYKFSSNMGRLMENLVAVELLRRKSYWKSNLEIYYWKNYQGKEVDFVIKEGLKIKHLVQVTHATAKDEIEPREIKALLKASQELNCKNLLVITWDYEAEEKIKRKKVKFVPLWKWLLSSQSKQ